MSLKALIRRAKEDKTKPESAAALRQSAINGKGSSAPAHVLPQVLHLPDVLPSVDARALIPSAVRPVWLVEEWLPEAVETQIEDLLRGTHRGDFVQLRGKRTARFGGDPGPPFLQEPVPEWLAQLCAAVSKAIEPCSAELDARPSSKAGDEAEPDRRLPNHVFINHYMPGEGIMPHTDGPAYEPWAVILSLGSAVTFDFWRDHAHSASGKPAALSVLVPPRSLLVFTGDAYAAHLHGIADRHADDLVDGVVANWTAETRARWWSREIDRPRWSEVQLDKPPDHPDAFGSSSVCGLKRRERFSLTLRRVPPASETGQQSPLAANGSPAAAGA